MITKLKTMTGLGLATLCAGIAHAQDVDWSSELGDHSGVTLNVPMITDPFIEPLAELSKEFEDVAGATVEIDPFGYTALHDTELLGCSQQSSEMDVLGIDAIWIGEFVEAGCLENLEDRIAADDDVVQWDDFTPGFSAQAVWEGSRYCVPIGAYYQLLFYRHDLFEAAGKEPPETFDELEELAAFFTDNPDFPGVKGFATNNARGVAAGQEFYQWLPSAGGRAWASNDFGVSPEQAYSDLTPTFDGAAVDLINYLKGMMAYGPTGVEGFDWDQRANAFASGNLAMTNMWSVRANLSNVPETSNVVGKFSTTQFPHAEGATSRPPAGGWVMCINAHSENKDAAWDYIKWVTSQEVHLDYARAGGPPSRISTFSDPQVRETFSWTDDLFISSQAAFSEVRPRHAATSQMIDLVGTEVNKALIGEQTPEEAVDAINEAQTNLLRRSGMLE
ncbi:extracellular solute-binding protein [bacterium]|nr:extracellular solute-binding protein [bacterium]